MVNHDEKKVESRQFQPNTQFLPSNWPEPRTEVLSD